MIKATRTIIISVFSILLICILSSCQSKEKKKETVKKPHFSQSAQPQIKRSKVLVLRHIPHEGDKTYTQGLEIHDGFLYESSGLDNLSALKKIDPENGKVLMQKDLPVYFAEGITIFNGHITVLSYRRGKTYAYSLESFADKGIGFNYETEGWGLTNDNSHFIMSDGSDKLFFRDPHTFKLVKTLHVKYGNKPLKLLNELEYVDGKVYANVYGDTKIYKINAETGQVEQVIDASDLACSYLLMSDPEAVLNGIAYDQTTNTFYITGKYCPYIYEVKFD